MSSVKVRKAQHKDIPVLTNLFLSNLEKQQDYISHGEIQMGVATDDGVVSENASEIWLRYISKKINECESEVLLYEDVGQVLGFIVVEISLRQKPYGTLCDIYVLPGNRAKGIGSTLHDAGISWLREQGAKEFFLESGKDNRAAHEFFEQKGFRLVSHIFYFKD